MSSAARESLGESLSPLLQGFSGEVSVAFHRFGDGFRYALNADKTLPAASLIKLPILVEALAQVEAGRVGLEDRISLKPEHMVGGNGVLRWLRPGLNPSFEDLLTLMIIVSDNTATNMVIDLVGLDAVNARCEALGLAHTRLIGKLQLPEREQNEAQRRGERNRTAAGDVLNLLTALQEGRLLKAEGTERALRMLERQLYKEALARYLPTDEELAAEPVTVASKSGCLRGVWHDAGLFFRRGQPLYALVVMTAGADDRSYGPEQEGLMLIAHVSRAVFAWVERGGESS